MIEIPDRLGEPEEIEVCKDCEEESCECDWEGFMADMQYDAMRDEGY